MAASMTQGAFSTASVNSAVHLPRLHTLSVINKGSYISRIFQLLTVPSLTKLSIHSRTAYSADHAISMLRRSGSTLFLRSLTLESSRDLEVAWEENYSIVCLLAEVKGVEELVLRVSKASDEIISRMTVRLGMGGSPQRNTAIMAYVNPGQLSAGHGAQWAKQGSVLLPKLKYFSLEDSSCASAGELQEMLQSRIPKGSGSQGGNEGPSNGVSKLSRVYLKLSRPAPPNYVELEVLQGLTREEGVLMDVVV
ncbi:hypothetical protein NMY22_g10228 [Coprinellus aureogranulatus]|nr:hypothetical protein NMY22_g10228 [Coprinellus aureogranulatus]